MEMDGREGAADAMAGLCDVVEDEAEVAARSRELSG